MTTTAVHRRVEHVMGMPISLALRGRHAHDAVADDAWADALASLHAADAVFSTYRSDSAISRLSRGEIVLDDCPPEVRQVIDLAERARQETGGAFNITHLDGRGRTVLDPSGIVKGWAAERASAAFAQLADTDFCLSAGGDMLCHVSDPRGPAWRIGIEHPADRNRLVATVPVHRGAVATSGSAHRGTHIIDPRSGSTPSTFASVTVVADSLTWADVDATTAVVLGDRALPWLADRPGRSGVVVWADGRAEVYGS